MSSMCKINIISDCGLFPNLQTNLSKTKSQFGKISVKQSAFPKNQPANFAD